MAHRANVNDLLLLMLPLNPSWGDWTKKAKLNNISIFGGQSLAAKLGGRNWFRAGEPETIVL